MVPSWIDEDKTDEFDAIFCDNSVPDCRECLRKQVMLDAIIQDVENYITEGEIQARDYGPYAPSPRFTSILLMLK